MAKLAFFELEKWMKPIIKKAFQKHHLVLEEAPLSGKNVSLAKDADVIAVFIYSKITPSILQSLPKVKLITTMSTGFDHIDVSAARSRGLTVCNVPSYGENTVAEHTMALILAVSRKIPQSVERAKKGSFSLEELRGFDLKGKTIGVVGGGKIGIHVVKYATAFDMNVLVFDVFQDPKLAKSMGFTYVPFEKLLKSSDIISFHAPYNPKTHHMLNEKNISKIKKGAVVVNTARGGLIETESLLHALDKGIVSFAALDVLEGECYIKEERQLLTEHFSKTCDLKTVLQDHMLLKNPKVFVTPHNAFNSQEALTRIVSTTIENVDAFLKKKPINIVKAA